MIISINGMDNSGKTTQSNILVTNFPTLFVKKFHINETNSFDRSKYNFDWWFAKDNKEEFVNAIYSCLAERISLAKQISEENNIVIMEKGLDFYDTRIVATLISKGCLFEEALEIQRKIRVDYPLEDVEELKIYLKSGNYRRDDKIRSDKEVLYNQYLLINQLLLERSNIDYRYVESDSIDNVTNQILGIVTEGMKYGNDKQKVRKFTRRV